jgi:predicted Zn-ribbon and HTH transcriptional regulator
VTAEVLPSGATISGGNYRCRECGYELEKPVGKVTNLPVCPRCQGERWERV